jgi:putative Holliday junction resolvase
MKHLVQVGGALTDRAEDRGPETAQVVVPGRVLGIDLGSRRIGLALSDSRRALATPWKTLERTPGGEEAVVEAVLQAVSETGATTVVVGLPLSLDGREGPAARAARSVEAGLRRRLGALGVEVATMDERFTTVSAEADLGRAGVSGRARRKTVDQVAAAVLLSAWLDQAR